MGILRRLLLLIRHFLPGVRIRVRLDGGFAHPDLLDLLEAEANLEYLVAMAKNAVLKRKAKPAMRSARKLSRQSGETEHVYGEAYYAAQSWPRQRRRHRQGRGGGSRSRTHRKTIRASLSPT